MTEREAVEAKMGQVAYQIATNNALRIAAEAKLIELNEQMRALSARKSALDAQESAHGEGRTSEER